MEDQEKKIVSESESNCLTRLRAALKVQGRLAEWSPLKCALVCSAMLLCSFYLSNQDRITLGCIWKTTGDSTCWLQGWLWMPTSFHFTTKATTILFHPLCSVSPTPPREYQAFFRWRNSDLRGSGFNSKAPGVVNRGCGCLNSEPAMFLWRWKC